MRYLRCKCGKSEAWTTDGMKPCQGCRDCGTTYAGSPEGHKPLEPHAFVIRYDSATGEPSKRMCTNCHQFAPLEDAAGA